MSYITLIVVFVFLLLNIVHVISTMDNAVSKSLDGYTYKGVFDVHFEQYHEPSNVTELQILLSSHEHIVSVENPYSLPDGKGILFTYSQLNRIERLDSQTLYIQRGVVLKDVIDFCSVSNLTFPLSFSLPEEPSERTQPPPTQPTPNHGVNDHRRGLASVWSLVMSDISLLPYVRSVTYIDNDNTVQTLTYHTDSFDSEDNSVFVALMHGDNEYGVVVGIEIKVTPLEQTLSHPLTQAHHTSNGTCVFNKMSIDAFVSPSFSLHQHRVASQSHSHILDDFKEPSLPFYHHTRNSGDHVDSEVGKKDVDVFHYTPNKVGYYKPRELVNTVVRVPLNAMDAHSNMMALLTTHRGVSVHIDMTHNAYLKHKQPLSHAIDAHFNAHSPQNTPTLDTNLNNMSLLSRVLVVDNLHDVYESQSNAHTISPDMSIKQILDAFRPTNTHTHTHPRTHTDTRTHTNGNVSSNGKGVGVGDDDDDDEQTNVLLIHHSNAAVSPKSIRASGSVLTSLNDIATMQSPLYYTAIDRHVDPAVRRRLNAAKSACERHFDSTHTHGTRAHHGSRCSRYGTEVRMAGFVAANSISGGAAYKRYRRETDSVSRVRVIEEARAGAAYDRYSTQALTTVHANTTEENMADVAGHRTDSGSLLASFMELSSTVSTPHSNPQNMYFTSVKTHSYSPNVAQCEGDVLDYFSSSSSSSLVHQAFYSTFSNINNDINKVKHKLAHQALRVSHNVPVDPFALFTSYRVSLINVTSVLSEIMYHPKLDNMVLFVADMVISALNTDVLTANSTHTNINNNNNVEVRLYIAWNVRPLVDSNHDDVTSRTAYFTSLATVYHVTDAAVSSRGGSVLANTFPVERIALYIHNHSSNQPEADTETDTETSDQDSESNDEEVEGETSEES